jgi:hypothetical protein
MANPLFMKIYTGGMSYETVVIFVPLLYPGRLFAVLLPASFAR